MKKLLTILLALALILALPALADETAEVSTDEILSALGIGTYRNTYNALMAGEVVQKGTKSEAARGVQLTLAVFGQKLDVDGNAGPKTIEALNAVQAAFGLPQTQVLDAKGYAELLRMLLIADKPDVAADLLVDQFRPGEFEYLRACALQAKGKFAAAKLAFENCEYGDWMIRAATCVQPWPKTGVLYKNPQVSGSSTELTVKYNSDPEYAMLVKIYTLDNTLARTMFIAGNSKATTRLPAGTYIIKDGRGTEWFGEEDSFGENGSYEIMTFSDGEQTVQLKKNYSSTITVNVRDSDPSGDYVGSDYEDYGDF